MMRVVVAGVLLLAAISCAAAQDEYAPDSFIRSPSNEAQPPSRRNVVTCPLATTPMIDEAGNRVCISRTQKPLQQPLLSGLRPAQSSKPKRKRFELSNKCPACK